MRTCDTAFWAEPEMHAWLGMAVSTLRVCVDRVTLMSNIKKTKQKNEKQQKSCYRCIDALVTMGVLVPGGDRTAVRRTAEFFLKNFEVRAAAAPKPYVPCIHLPLPDVERCHRLLLLLTAATCCFDALLSHGVVASSL